MFLAVNIDIISLNHTYNTIIPLNDVSITSNPVTTLFWRKDDVIIVSYVHWVVGSSSETTLNDNAPSTQRIWLVEHTYVLWHYNDVIMGAIASQITSPTIVYSAVYSDANQRKHQSSASLAFVQGIHRGPVNSPHKWPVTRKIFPFDDVIMCFFLIDWFRMWTICMNFVCPWIPCRLLPAD